MRCESPKELQNRRLDGRMCFKFSIMFSFRQHSWKRPIHVVWISKRPPEQTTRRRMCLKSSSTYSFRQKSWKRPINVVWISKRAPEQTTRRQNVFQGLHYVLLSTAKLEEADSCGVNLQKSSRTDDSMQNVFQVLHYVFLSTAKLEEADSWGVNLQKNSRTDDSTAECVSSSPLCFPFDSTVGRGRIMWCESPKELQNRRLDAECVSSSPLCFPFAKWMLRLCECYERLQDGSVVINCQVVTGSSQRGKAFWRVNVLTPRKHNTSTEANNSPNNKEICKILCKQWANYISQERATWLYPVPDESCTGKQIPFI
jgi:hypothetical protein